MEKRPRALVVEDDRSWQQILGENLADAGLEVDTVGSLQEALSSLRTIPHRIAVVDLSLVGEDPHNQDGLRVLQGARQMDPGCATILVTGFATVELAVNALKEFGAFSVLRKETFQRRQFRDLVHQALLNPPLPAKDPGTSVAQGKKPVLASPGSKKFENKSILVVEDDAGWRSILSELLSDAGFPVQLCSSFGEALSYLRRESFDLALVDLSLSNTSLAWDDPGSQSQLEGYHLLEATKAADIPTIVVSGVSDPTQIERAYQEFGVFAYLEKQAFDRKAFIRLVQEARSAHQSNHELDVLTDREREVLEMLAKGLTNKEIADQLVISTNTIKRHLKAIFVKLKIHTRAAAVAKLKNP